MKARERLVPAKGNRNADGKLYLFLMKPFFSEITAAIKKARNFPLSVADVGFRSTRLFFSSENYTENIIFKRNLALIPTRINHLRPIGNRHFCSILKILNHLMKSIIGQ